MPGLLTGHHRRKCSQRNFSGHRHCGSDSHIVRKYSSRQLLLSSKINYKCGCHLTGISEGIWLYECLFGKWLVKIWKFLTISNYSITEAVRNNFIKERVIVKSNDFLSRTNRGHASTLYNSTGKHFVLNRLRTTSSEAYRPTLQKIALNALKYWHLFWSYKHLNALPLNTYMPTYRHWETLLIYGRHYLGWLWWWHFLSYVRGLCPIMGSLKSK